jgi:hypothetical protein
MSARAGWVVVALRGELEVCTAADGLSALAADGARVVVDLADTSPRLATSRRSSRRSTAD